VMVEITERMLEITERLYGPLAQAVVWLRRYSEEELSAILGFVVKSTEVQQERAAEIRALALLEDDAGPAKVTSPVARQERSARSVDAPARAHQTT
jgi:hypothetical protein